VLLKISIVALSPSPSIINIQAKIYWILTIDQPFHSLIFDAAFKAVAVFHSGNQIGTIKLIQ